MVLMPGCLCCGQAGCPRLCSNITHAAFRFHIPAGSGDPFANLPLKRFAGNYQPNGFGGFDPLYDTDWVPEHPHPRDLSWPEIDETLVIDLTQPPPTTVAGTHGSVVFEPVTDHTGALVDCILSVGFSYSLNICTWPYWRWSASLGWVYQSSPMISESVGISLRWFNGLFTPFPYVVSAASLGAANFALSKWARYFRVDESSTHAWHRHIVREPAVFRDCNTQPESWPITTNASAGLVAGNEYTPDNYTDPGNPFDLGSTILIPYLTGHVDGADYTLQNPNFVSTEEPLRWRRLLPEPTLTVTVT